ncbi:MAG: hypothetical protein PWP04_235 [Candidatus Atribacteria bacterium]|nr:hypothetical protein [Candidatus Atribacteria bacterium]
MKTIPGWITQKEIVKDRPTDLWLKVGVGIMVLVFVIVGLLGVYFYPSCPEQDLLFFEQALNPTFTSE